MALCPHGIRRMLSYTVGTLIRLVHLYGWDSYTVGLGQLCGWCYNSWDACMLQHEIEILVLDLGRNNELDLTCW